MRSLRQDDPDQAEIAFPTSVSVVPEASVAEVARMVELLRGKGWQTAEDLAANSAGLWNERKVRRIARAAVPGIVSYPGSPGYKLWLDCSVEEIDHAIEAFESQARDMQSRALLYRQAYHARYRGGLTGA